MYSVYVMQIHRRYSSFHRWEVRYCTKNRPSCFICWRNFAISYENEPTFSIKGRHHMSSHQRDVGNNLYKNWINWPRMSELCMMDHQNWQLLCSPRLKSWIATQVQQLRKVGKLLVQNNELIKWAQARTDGANSCSVSHHVFNYPQLLKVLFKLDCNFHSIHFLI